MSVLVIGGVSLQVVRQPTADGATWRLADEGGALGRSAGGRQGGAVFWQKRQWTVQPAPMTAVEVAALEAAAPAGQIVACSGDVLGASVSCVVAITSQRLHRLKGGTFNYRVTLTLTEA